jgi:hypothetical protein
MRRRAVTVHHEEEKPGPMPRTYRWRTSLPTMSVEMPGSRWISSPGLAAGLPNVSVCRDPLWILRKPLGLDREGAAFAHPGNGEGVHAIDSRRQLDLADRRLSGRHRHRHALGVETREADNQRLAAFGHGQAVSAAALRGRCDPRALHHDLRAGSKSPVA